MSEQDNTIKDALMKMMASYGLEKGVQRAMVANSWNELMGEHIARLTTEVSFRDGVLFVKMRSAPMKDELARSKARILEILEKEHGPGVVRDVWFK